MVLNWTKIIGVTGVSFLSSLAGLLTIDSLCGGIIPAYTLIPASLVVAVIQGGLAFFRELTVQAEERDKKMRRKYDYSRMARIKLGKLLENTII